MMEERLTRVLIAPLVSEKSTAIAERRIRRKGRGAAVLHTAVFRVLADANRREIAAAVEKMFEVKVAAVRVLNVGGKRVGGRGGAPGGRRAGWKKAYIRLAEGHDINLGEAR